MPYLDRLLTAATASAVVPNGMRPRLLRRLGVQFGADPVVFAGLGLVAPRNLKVGDGVFINDRCYIDATAGVTIGHRVNVASGCSIITASHAWGTWKRAGEPDNQPITVGDGSWLGANVTILAGVTVGAGCMIAAGAVVTRDCEPDGLYAGVPARRVRDLPALG